MKKFFLAMVVVTLICGSFTTALHAAPQVQAGWQEKWDKTVAEAKKEGTVSAYVAGWGPSTRKALTDAFKAKYGINVEFTSFGRGAEMVARAEKEKLAGLNIADIFPTGPPTLLTIMKPRGLLGNFESLLLLPEVTDPKPWGGKLPYIDKDKTSFAMTAAIQRYVSYNTNMVKKGEITSFKDVLKPQYKGKITMNDPTSTGPGNGLISFLAKDAWNLQEAKDFLTQLIRQQEVVIMRDNRLHVESVARGKYAIGLAPWPDVMTEFLKAGAPLDVAILKEGTVVVPAAGAIGVPTIMAHPNAGRLFINWLLTREGQTVLAQSYGYPSLRLDVPTDGIYPAYLPQGKGDKFFTEMEDYYILQGQMLGVADEVIKAAMK